MKKITFLLFILCLSFTTWTYGQCTTDTGGFWPANIVSVSNAGSITTIATDNWPNAEKSAIDGLIIGNTYEVNATNTTSVYITVVETTPAFDTIGTVLSSGASTTTFTATTTEVIILWHLNALCATQNSDETTTTIQCTSASCTCTDTAVPACTTLISPVDGEMSAATTLAADSSRRVELTWNAVPTATSYNISFDGVVLGATPNTTVGITGLDYSTAYTWSVIPVNCFGEAVGCATWNFTTEVDPALSVEDFDAVSFSAYPNPTKDIINIETTLTIDSIEIINMLGQTVRTFKNNAIIDNTINIQSLDAGLYFLNITAEGKNQSIKITKE